MPILGTEIKYYRSTNDLGGAITASEITSNQVNNLWDDIDGLGSANGETNYRCLYVRNINTSLTLQSAVVYLLSNSSVTGVSIEVGLGTSPINGTEQSVPNENTAPAGVIFSTAEDFANALSIGDIPSDSFKAIWLKRVVVAGVNPFTNDSPTLRVSGQTAQ